jgi:hypothetical protein
MSGEYIQSSSIKDYWKQLKAYYQLRSSFYQEIDRNKYEQLERGEREDSDNHLNFERLGTDSQVVDVAFYKYLPDGKIAFRVHLVDVGGQQEDHYFLVNSFS